MSDGKLLFCMLVSLLIFSSFPAENAAQNGDNRSPESGGPQQADIVQPKENEGSEKAQEMQEAGDAVKKEDVVSDNDDTKEVNEDKNEEKQEEENDERKPEEKEVGMDLKLLDDDSFEHLTQASSGATTGDWLVLFTKNDCQQCNEVENALKIVHARFHHGKMIAFGGEKNMEDILKFATEDFKFAPWSGVNKPYSKIDLMVEEASDELRHMINYKKLVSAIIFLLGIVVGILLTSICGSVLFYLTENFRDDEDDVMQSYEIKNKSE